MNARATQTWSAAALLALAAAAGCMTVGRDYETPQTDLPPSWRDEPHTGLAAGDADLAQWWLALGDPVLTDLVERATRQGTDVREALSRVHEARALRGIAASERFPSVDATASFRREGQSENTQFGGFVQDTGTYTAGFDAAWELDLWGRVRRSVEAADAALESVVEDARDVAVTVAAETAVNYVQMRAFQQRLAIAKSNVELQEQTLALVRARFESGLVGERDVAQAATNVETTRSRVPQLEIGVRITENRLAVLLAQPPGALSAELGEPRAVPYPPASVAVGVPTDLLRRRADVRRAERVLAAETARIGVAEGDLYPRFALLGSLGVAAESSQDLFSSGSSVYTFGPSMRWNVFDAGRRRFGVEAQDARAEQARLGFERAVLDALEEAENAMMSFVHEQMQRTSLAAAVSQARLAAELANTQYQEGITDFQTVLDSERALADLEDQLAQNDASISISLIALYKALGGGWETIDPTAPAEETDAAPAKP